MRTTRTAILGAVAVACAALPATAAAEERTCRGTIGPQTVDNLRVPDGATCTLEGTRVKGTVKVERAASLTARDIKVVGNVQAENAAKAVVKAGSAIGGSFQAVQGSRAELRSSRIEGDVLLDDNSRPLAVTRNVVNGDVQAFQNTGGVEIANNRIDANLQCKENAPPPTGGGNVVQGNKEDQCKRL